jgi:hypothetical protein
MRSQKRDPVTTQSASNDTLFRIFAAMIALAGLYHMLGLVMPAISPQTPAWRHALFVGINIATAWLMLRRPPWFWAVFAVLTLQQLYGHGGKIIRVWQSVGRIEWISLLVVILMPIMAVLLYRDWRLSRESVRLP